MYARILQEIIDRAAVSLVDEDLESSKYARGAMMVLQEVQWAFNLYAMDLSPEEMEQRIMEAIEERHQE